MSDREKAIRRCITHHIQDQNLPEDDGLRGQALVKLCLQKFYSEERGPELIKTEKTFVMDVMRRMIEDRILVVLKKDNKPVFRLDPYFNYKDKMHPSASQPSEDPQGTQEALEALDKEKSADAEAREGQQPDHREELAEEPTEEQVYEQIEDHQDRQDGQLVDQDDTTEAISELLPIALGESILMAYLIRTFRSLRRNDTRGSTSTTRRFR
jgi:MCM6 C-terminal winged-helix domain